MKKTFYKKLFGSKLFSGSHSNRQLPSRPLLEEIESRIVPSVTMAPTFQINHSTIIHPQGGPGVGGYTPAQIEQAYAINNITFQNGTLAGNGKGQTIAIVDAYDDPNIASDLATFDSQFNIPASPNFLKVGINSQGTSSTTHFPKADSGWAMEITLDVEWAHAIAPAANILLVEANSANLGDLLNAVNYARNASGVSVVSMSWGAGEFSGETSYDNYFTTPAGHNGVSFVGSSGDSGSPSIWPALSTRVIGVGGTSLNLAGNSYSSETGWSGSGGSLSQYEKTPSWQQGLVIHSGSKTISSGGFRAGPDVAYDADPSTGFDIYDTYGSGGWSVVGGTSAGAPQWAALIGIANQGRVASSLGTLDGTTTLADLYKLPSQDFHSITSGSNGGYSDASGYNLVDGLGSPVANLVIQGLVGTTSGGGGTGGTGGGSGTETLAVKASTGTQTITTVVLQAAGTDSLVAESNLIYTWSLTSSPTGSNVTLSVNGTNSAKDSTATFSLAGNYTFQVLATDPAGITATATVSVTVSQVFSSVAVTPGSVTLAPGTSTTLAGQALDQFGNSMSSTISWSLVSNGSGVTLSSAGVLSSTSAATGTFQAVASATIAGVTLSGTANVTIGSPVLFQDDFSGGGGNWTVTSGPRDYAIVSTPAGNRLQVSDFSSTISRVVAGSSNWTNYSYQATLNFNWSTYGSVSLAAREIDNTHLYFFGYNVPLGEWMIAIRNGATTSILATSVPMTVYANQDYAVQANLSGSSLSLYVNNSLVASASDSTFTHGQIGLTATDGMATLGNVVVQVLNGPHVLSGSGTTHGQSGSVSSPGQASHGGASSATNYRNNHGFDFWSGFSGQIEYNSLPETGGRLKMKHH